MQNVSPVHTYFSAPGAPGQQLVSFRMAFASIATQINIFGQVLITAFIMLIVYFRDKRGCYIFWYTMFAICVFFCFLCVAALGQQWGTANRAGAFGNLANDLQYCCAYPGGGCPNTIPCTNPVKQPNQLSANSDFLGLFWLNVIFFLADGIFVIVIVVVTRKPVQEPQEPPEEEQETQKVEEIPPVVEPSVAPAVRTGLRNRK